MRSDALYLQDIVDAIRSIAKFVEITSFAAFVTDDMRQSAVLQKLCVIGEAATRISDKSKLSAPEVPWRKIIGFRNIAVHAYFAIDWETVWVAATENAPELLELLGPLLEAENVQ